MQVDNHNSILTRMYQRQTRITAVSRARSPRPKDMHDEEAACAAKHSMYSSDFNNPSRTGHRRPDTEARFSPRPQSPQPRTQTPAPSARPYPYRQHRDSQSQSSHSRWPSDPNTQSHDCAPLSDHRSGPRQVRKMYHYSGAGRHLPEADLGLSRETTWARASTQTKYLYLRYVCTTVARGPGWSRSS